MHSAALILFFLAFVGMSIETPYGGLVAVSDCTSSKEMAWTYDSNTNRMFYYLFPIYFYSFLFSLFSFLFFSHIILTFFFQRLLIQMENVLKFKVALLKKINLFNFIVFIHFLFIFLIHFFLIYINIFSYFILILFLFYYLLFLIL